MMNIGIKQHSHVSSLLEGWLSSVELTMDKGYPFLEAETCECVS